MMEHRENMICKVCLCENIDVKHFTSDNAVGSKNEVSFTSASSNTPEQICTKCLTLEQSKVEIKTEHDEIHIEETTILNICKSEEVDVKKEEEDVETFLGSFTDVDCNNCDNVKISASSNTPEQICIKCLTLEQSKVKIKTEHDEIHIEETTILNICKSEEVDVKKEEEDVEIFQDSFTDVDCNSFCDNVKIEYNDTPVEDPLHVVTNCAKSSAYKPFKCDMCDKQFDKARSLKSHQRIHKAPPKEPHKCDVCSKIFSCPSHLKRHQIIHTEKKPFKCDVCDKEFNCVNNLKVHKLSHITTREKSHQCVVCQKYFYTLGELKIHQQTHLGLLIKERPIKEKQYKCNSCDKAFYNAYALRRHQLTHTGEKPFKCSVCEKQFTQIDNLKIHRETHKTRERFHKCDVCQINFCTSGELKLHHKVHIYQSMTEEPYECDVCYKEFYNSVALKRHQKIHNNVYLGINVKNM